MSGTNPIFPVPSSAEIVDGLVESEPETPDRGADVTEELSEGSAAVEAINDPANAEIIEKLRGEG